MIPDVKALYEFKARSSDELSFNGGDIIAVTSKTVADGWWLGSNSKGETGLIPISYFEESCDENGRHENFF